MTSITQAAVNALARYFDSSVSRYLDVPTVFTSNGTGRFGIFVVDSAHSQADETHRLGAFVTSNRMVRVTAGWPEPAEPLPPMAITMLAVGTPTDILLQPTPISKVNTGSNRAVFRWRVLQRTQPIQVDVWATYDNVRHSLVAALDQVLNHGGMLGHAPDVGLVLPLRDGWDGVAAYDFGGPQNQDAPGGIQVSEYRSMYHGQARVVLYVDEVSPRLARIKLLQRIK